VIGIDLCPDAVTYARNRYVDVGGATNLDFATMDASRLGFRDQSFEMVTSIEVIEHLDDPEGYLAEIRRLLCDAGTLVLSTPNKRISSPTPGSMWPHHVREFYRHELQAMLEHHFSSVEMWALSIPVYERHPLRRLVHLVAPLFKPVLPQGIRTRFLPTLQSKIKSELTLDDVLISQTDVEKQPTLMAVCHA
jgi:ubiquinone/menaquinone biosynthesis C-methylase UbiE